MGSKRSRTGSTALRRREVKLRDVQEGKVEISIWTLRDPEKTYDANVCGIHVDARDLILTFGQTLPGTPKLMNAVSIAMPRLDAANLLEGFSEIRTRLAKLEFAEQELESCHLDTMQMDSLTGQTFVRFSAELVRASSGDDVAIVDFYRRPLMSPALAEAQPNRKLEIPPVIRISCSTLLLSALLSMISNIGNGD